MLGLAIAIYCLLIIFIIRFIQVGHSSDEKIKKMFSEMKDEKVNSTEDKQY